MHAASNGCYQVQNIAVENRLVTTNKSPIGLNRGYGGPQFHFGLERVMDTAARQLNMDAEIRRRTFRQMPSRRGAGRRIYDQATTERPGPSSGDVRLRRPRRQAGGSEAAGHCLELALVPVSTVGLEHGLCNAAQTPEERERAGGRSAAPLSQTSISILPAASPSSSTAHRLDKVTTRCRTIVAVRSACDQTRSASTAP